MDPQPQSSLPVRTSGIPRPTSRLPVLRPSASQTQLRQPASTEQLRKKPSLSSLSRPAPATLSSLQKKPSRTSLVRSTTPAAAASIATAKAGSNSNRASLISAPKRTVSNTAQSRLSTSNAPTFKKPTVRPPSRQTRPGSRPLASTQGTAQDDDVLGDLDAFRSASRASSRAGFRETESEHTPDTDSDPSNPSPAPRKARPSLSDRTIESLSQLPASPARTKGRRRSSFFNNDGSMPPPMRPASALGNSRRPMTSDGTPQQPATPRRPGGPSQRGSMTAPGKRSVSAAVPTSTAATPSKPPSLAASSSQLRKLPLSQMQNVSATPKPRPLSNSKTMTARTPKARPSLVGTFGEAISPPGTAKALTPPPNRASPSGNRTPETSRKVSGSSAALRDQIAKAKAARRADAAPQATKTPEKATSSSSALREQIAKAKEAARRAHTSKQFGTGTPPREVPAVTEGEFSIEPDPEEISQFDFGLDDPFNQQPKGSKSVLKKRIDGARMEGRLNIAAMGLSEFPEEVLNMYTYDPNDTTVAWGEVVDLTSLIAADNELARLPEELFPDVDMESLVDSDDAGPQFGGVQNLDFHGNVLCQLPLGLRRLTQLTKLNLSRNKLGLEALDVVFQISTLRELKLADNGLEGCLSVGLGSLTQLEVLELQGNKLTGLPHEIRELVHLRLLNVSDNKLRELPSELFSAVPLIELIANKNALSGTFFHTDSAPHLQKLHLANNAISSLCETDTIEVPALQFLELSANRLVDLPDVSTWTSLTTLLVGENKLGSLPTGFISLQHLRTADFTGNDITKLDEKIALMDNLDNLTIAANPLRERKFLSMNTDDIKRDLLSRLEPAIQEVGDEVEAFDTPLADGKENLAIKPSGTLDLSFQNFTVLEDDTLSKIANRDDVRQVYVQQNYLTGIPNILSQLTFLSVLDISKNNITTPLIEEIQLPKLKELRMHGNRLQSLDALTSFLKAPSLQHLDVSNNRIGGPLPRVRDSFPELSLLMASDNAITEVSHEALEGLRTVGLSNNEISRLEPQIGLLLGSLTSLDVEGNTFRVPNYALLRKGTESVLTWLKDRIPSPTEEFFVPEKTQGY